ncbi:hypothetical protein SUGI_0057090 [Cryptomeria japonica]|nr:hypothetical protein SUGI_0057090 [Cryptomeria japonica]
MEELELCVYMIHEEGVVVPNLEKGDNQLSNQQGEQQNNELCQLYFDGSRSKVGSGGGVMLISPEGKKYFLAFRFSFSCTNNTAEYESLAHGLEWARKRNVKCLQVFGDSELVLNQVRGVNVTKNDVLKMYKYTVWDLIEEFDAFNLLSMPRNQNKEVDKLAALGAQFDILDEAEFAAGNQHKFVKQYENQILQLKSNKVPKGLVTLESIFNTDDQYEDLKGFNPTLAQHTIELEADDKPMRQKKRPLIQNLSIS